MARQLILAALLVSTAFAEKRVQFVEMEVWDVVRVDAGEQHVVLLRTKSSPRRILPIWIGQSEALAIQLRLARQLPPRPLTHDLIEQLLRAMDARVVKIHVEALRDRIFLGRIYLKRGDKTHDMDARPSDSIALALGARAPIFVARTVLDQAGLDADGGPGEEPGDAGELLRRTDWTDKGTSL